MPDYKLDIIFDDDRRVWYDVRDDINEISSYGALKDIHGLFDQARLDESRTCVFWNDEIDLPSDILYEYGTPVEDVMNVAEKMSLYEEQ